MQRIILIDDNGQQHDITQAVREKMGDFFTQNQPSAQPMRHMHRDGNGRFRQGAQPMHQHHMQGMENAMPLPQGMTPEDFAGDENVRFIPVPAPMPGMNREIHGIPMNERPMMHGHGMPQAHMPNFQHQQMRGGFTQAPNFRHGQMFNKPIPSPVMMNPYYQVSDRWEE